LISMTPSCPLNLTLGVFAVPSIESASISGYLSVIIAMQCR
jgi:hypothetical protein